MEIFWKLKRGAEDIKKGSREKSVITLTWQVLKQNEKKTLNVIKLHWTKCRSMTNASFKAFANIKTMDGSKMK